MEIKPSILCSGNVLIGINAKAPKEEILLEGLGMTVQRAPREEDPEVTREAVITMLQKQMIIMILIGVEKAEVQTGVEDSVGVPADEGEAGVPSDAGVRPEEGPEALPDAVPETRESIVSGRDHRLDIGHLKDPPDLLKERVVKAKTNKNLPISKLLN